MTCRSIRRATWAAVALAAAEVVHASSARAQAPATPPPTTVPAPAPPALALYRAPVIALVQPAAGGSVPQDKPVVVFRFAQGEANDAIDARSFTVAVDGKDVTPAFQIAAGEAWGALASTGAAESSVLAPGVHELIARICSERGACTSVAPTITVLETRAPSQPASGEPTSKRNRILDLVLRATRKLLLP